MGFVLLKKRRLEKAEQSLNAGKRVLALKLAKPLLHARNAEVAHRANRLSGLALYKQKKYQDSLPFFKTACQLGNYRHDWYNFAIALVYSGNAAIADDAFQNIYRTKIQPGYLYSTPTPILLFQYMRALIQQGKTEKARQRANELKQMYAGVGISDINIQKQRGLPTYPTFRNEIISLFQPEELDVWEKQIRK
jgi:tetratricopeptide (TPR) repeat protein